MFVAKTVFTILAVASFALATITITGPSSDDFWIQFTENNVTWTTDSSSDPTTANIVITNSNNTFLNGNFSIQSAVDLASLTFTDTNVTLVLGGGYVVNFVNPSNLSDVFASSQEFQVKPLGTAPPNVTTTATSPATTATQPGNSSSTSSGSSTSTSSSSTTTNNSNAAPRSNDMSMMLPFVSTVMILAGAALAF